MITTSWTPTLYDIIGHLVPGLALIEAFQWMYPLPVSTAIVSNPTSILVSGYLAGHFLHALGSLVCDLRPMKWVSSQLIGKPNNKQVKQKLKELVAKKLKIKVENDLQLFAIADSLIAKTKFEERKILLAKEAFYRSLVVLTILISGFVVNQNMQQWKLLTICGGLLTLIWFWRRETYRRIKNDQVYILAIRELQNGTT